MIDKNKFKNFLPEVVIMNAFVGPTWSKALEGVKVDAMHVQYRIKDCVYYTQEVVEL